ncbi:ATP-binding protein [Anaerovorax odorimutans]|uniref:histidine kinase n=1 Tax=Anaerovorax odorimutans TaxID=109327 RepID=A0ABT1RKT2_9FIRM|nr:histidine kinase dimerization/phospho-acceptor domain-containing protein [Anaerovorax odorimutans]MCQ4635787.1 ATP-binding protein [Anaerovorax odorimutans]
MDTKSKKSKNKAFIAAFVVCFLSFLASVVGIIGASRLNAYSGYADLYFLGNGEFPVEFDFLAAQMKIWLVLAIVMGVIALLSLIYLVVTVGAKDEQGKIGINRFDRVFAEIQLAALAIILFGGGSIVVNVVDNLFVSVYGIGNYASSAFEISIDVITVVLLGGGCAALGLGLVLSCVKKVKAGEFLERSACGWLIHKIYTEIYMGGSMMRKVVLVAILICLLSATIFLAPVMLIVILVFAPRWVNKYDEIKKGIKEVSEGNLDYKIPVEGEGELDQLAAGINEISKATSIAVQNELKNQRMKTDLISNVSHDLKTPLTSMVTYIDLLKTEGLDSENAPEYLDVLEQKTERLRQLTEDLFEAAKASSGAIPVRMSRVDLLSLVNQGLGELNQRVEESQLDFIINADHDRYFVKADGQLLWRVTSNLLSNALKYSQPHTRVYIDFRKQKAESGELVIMEMKNISRQSLNIDPSELMERFKRGDESRTTEGSGLGLAIAKDLMKLMDGWIELAIDGDLFKVKVMLSAASADEPIVMPDDMPMEMGPMEVPQEPEPAADDEFAPEDLEPENLESEEEAPENFESEGTELGESEPEEPGTEKPEQEESESEDPEPETTEPDETGAETPELEDSEPDEPSLENEPASEDGAGQQGSEQSQEPEDEEEADSEQEANKK